MWLIADTGEDLTTDSLTHAATASSEAGASKPTVSRSNILPLYQSNNQLMKRVQASFLSQWGYSFSAYYW